MFDLEEIKSTGERDVILFKFLNYIVHIRDIRIDLCVRRCIESLKLITQGKPENLDVKLVGKCERFKSLLHY